MAVKETGPTDLHDPPKRERADGQLSCLSGELFVAAELLKRGLQTSVTFGSAKAIDILAFHPTTGRTFTVQVKTVRAKNYLLMSHAKVDPRHVYVFVVLNKPNQAGEYFIVLGIVLSTSPERFSKSFLDPKMPGIHPKVLEQEGFKDRWDVFEQPLVGDESVFVPLSVPKAKGQEREFDEDAMAKVFDGDETAYLAWLHSNPDAFVLNTRNPPTPRYLMAHRATCTDVGREGHTTGDYMKVGAPSLDALQAWAGTNVGGTVTRCRRCKP